MPEFYIIIAQKYFSRILGGHVPPWPTCPLTPSPRLLRLCSDNNNPKNKNVGSVLVTRFRVLYPVCYSMIPL